MIVTLATFQRGLLKIPNSVPAPNGADKTIELQEFIDIYEREILIDGLGATLYEEVKAAYNTLETASQPIQDLVNGKTYEYNGKQVIWEGLKGKDSLLAYYIYWKFIQETADLFSSFGVERPEGKGSNGVSIIPRATAAYRTFFEKYQGDIYTTTPRIVRTRFAVGIDYYGDESSTSSLYKFLSDNSGLYPDAVFTLKENINSFGL